MPMYLWIAVGSALGGMARYWCTGFAAGMLGETFPWGTLLVNITGSLIIGFFATLTGPDSRDCGRRGQDRPIRRRHRADDVQRPRHNRKSQGHPLPAKAVLAIRLKPSSAPCG